MASFPIGDVAWKHRNGLSTGIAHGRPTMDTVGERLVIAETQHRHSEILGLTGLPWTQSGKTRDSKTQH